MKEFYFGKKKDAAHITYATMIRTHGMFHRALARHDEETALRTEFMDLWEASAIPQLLFANDSTHPRVVNHKT